MSAEKGLGPSKPNQSQEFNDLLRESLADSAQARARLRLFALSAELTKRGADAEMIVDDAGSLMSLKAAALEVDLGTELGRQIISRLAESES